MIITFMSRIPSHRLVCCSDCSLEISFLYYSDTYVPLSFPVYQDSPEFHRYYIMNENSFPHSFRPKYTSDIYRNFHPLSKIVDNNHNISYDHGGNPIITCPRFSWIYSRTHLGSLL